MANVGTDKDSDRRQRAAIASFARSAGFHVEEEFYDPGVSGADPIETRPGFSALLDRIEGNGIRTVLVEDASRFARDLVTQELGILLLEASSRQRNADGFEVGPVSMLQPAPSELHEFRWHLARSPSSVA
jgi:DNA invertase Pin-like site-specific DNA recombinase